MSSQQIRIEGLHKHETLQINANTSLQEVLQQFCDKYNLNSSEYALVSKHKKSLDMTLPFRLTGLSSNARLEIVPLSDVPASYRKKSSSSSSSKKPSKCVIGIQLPNSERHRMECKLRDTLWMVLKQLESEKNINVTRVTVDQNQYFMPQLSSMKAEYKTWDDLKNSLRKVGLKRGDNALLRLTFAPTGKTLAEMETTIQQMNEESGTKTQPSNNTVTEGIKESVSSSSPSTTTATTPAASPATTTTAAQNAPNTTTTEIPTTDVTIPLDDKLVAKQVKLFRVGTGASTTLDDITDDDFKLRASELRAMVSEITKRQKQRDRLLPSKYREQEQEKKRRKYDQALIRVRFPQGFMLQGSFRPHHKLKDISQMIQSVLQQSNTPFYLYTAPPIRRYENAEATLEELGFVPASILNISTKSGSLELRQDMIEKYSQNLTDQTIPQSQTEDNTKSVVSSRVGSSSSTRKSPSEAGDKKYPKWFKMGFKK